MSPESRPATRFLVEVRAYPRISIFCTSLERIRAWSGIDAATPGLLRTGWLVTVVIAGRASPAVKVGINTGANGHAGKTEILIKCCWPWPCDSWLRHLAGE